MFFTSRLQQPRHPAQLFSCFGAGHVTPSFTTVLLVGHFRGFPVDPNRPNDERYIVDLVGKVVRVSVETVGIVEGLPAEYTTPPQAGEEAS